ncbi:MAG: phospho-N-acetylmuramoyl-pentapeptide-transferase [Neomegalonema sp.]|nr:phospho-N-acetylmuramoyl-pentapeptide-transferase [Neomegalonema sp.]
MLYHLFAASDGAQPLLADVNIFRYLTFRTFGAILTSLLICFMLGRRVIDFLRVKQGKGQPIREEGPESHYSKRGTPTMGGVMILGALTISTLLWSRLDNPFVWVVLLSTLGFGLIGFADDLAKVRKYTTAGISSKLRLLIGFSIAAAAAYVVSINTPEALRFQVAFPLFKDAMLYLSWLFIPFAMFVIVGAANAVNLTDGLDGLAIVPVMLAAMCFGIFSYVTGNAILTDYLLMPYVPGVEEIAVFCGALIGAGLGFLWYNAPPARVFMGDTGSLALGGGLGAAAVATKHEVVLAVIGGLFVVETLSVIIQVAYFKRTGKRVFLMAPIHHHFEKKGWQEPTIVIRFWIISVILALIGLATLKLR